MIAVNTFQQITNSNCSDGLTFLPNALFDNYSTLGLTPSELVVYINIWRHWTHPNELPCPSNKVIAKSTGFRPRTVNWYTAKLHGLGFIERIERLGVNGSNKTNQYNLSPLLKCLEKIVKPMPIFDPRPSDNDDEVIKGIGHRYGATLSVFGSTAIPNALLDRQSELGITQAELFFLLNLFRYFHSTKSASNVTLQQFALQMGMQKRRISALITKLVRKGLLIRQTRVNGPNEYDISPLIHALSGKLGEIPDVAHDMDTKVPIENKNVSLLWHNLLTSENFAL